MLRGRSEGRRIQEGEKRERKGRGSEKMGRRKIHLEVESIGEHFGCIMGVCR